MDSNLHRFAWLHQSSPCFYHRGRLASCRQFQFKATWNFHKLTATGLQVWSTCTSSEVWLLLTGHLDLDGLDLRPSRNCQLDLCSSRNCQQKHVDARAELVDNMPFRYFQSFQFLPINRSITKWTRTNHISDCVHCLAFRGGRCILPVNFYNVIVVLARFVLPENSGSMIALFTSNVPSSWRFLRIWYCISSTCLVEDLHRHLSGGHELRTILKLLSGNLVVPECNSVVTTICSP